MKIIFILFLPLFILAKSYSAQNIIHNSMRHQLSNASEIKINLVLIDKKTKSVEKRILVVKNKTKDKKRMMKFEFKLNEKMQDIKYLLIKDKANKFKEYIYYSKQNKINEVLMDNSNDNFFNTDFLYYDFKNNFISNAKLKKLEDEKVGNYSCYSIEVISSEKSPYSKVILNIRKRDFFPLRIKFYDKNNKYFKKYIVKKLKKINNKLIIKKAYLVDRKREHATIINLEDINLKSKFDELEFNKDNLN